MGSEMCIRDRLILSRFDCSLLRLVVEDPDVLVLDFDIVLLFVIVIYNVQINWYGTTFCCYCVYVLTIHLLIVV